MTKKKLADSFFIHNQRAGVNLRKREVTEKQESEELQDEALTKNEEKEKARHRKRGPYRKAHADW